MADMHRYLLTIVPPKDLITRIADVRKWVSETFGCTKATRPPVHITLLNPFELPDDEEQQLFKAVQSFADHRFSFQLELKNYDFFPNNPQPVAFINVVENADYKNLSRNLATHLRAEFPELKRDLKASDRAHFTVAYRDTASIFPALKAELLQQHFSASFYATNITLFRWEGTWRFIHQFPFGNDTHPQTPQQQPTLF